MSNPFPKSPPESIIYEDDVLYVCMASFPMTKGHSIVVWKEEVADLHLLKEGEYDYLMDMVNATRDALLETLSIKKVYLLYMDEARHVHWHLLPRYNEMGYDVFHHEPKEMKDFSLVGEIQKKFIAPHS
jgi:diadenosine tetraphosphate (Ap4A) HIT family hydrolase